MEASPSPTGEATVPDAVAPPPRHPRFALIDGVRAVAVLAIVVVHSAVAGGATGQSLAGRLLAHLNVGVAIFFVVSGFLLYRPFIAHRVDGPASPSVGDYAKRRALRILPAYWLALAILTVVPGLTGVYDGHWLAQAGLVQILPPAPTPSCTQAALSCGLAQTWSLVVEATFYLLLPLYVLGSESLFRLSGARRWATVELGALAVLSTLSLAVVFSSATGAAAEWVRNSALGYVLWFALGMGLAIVSVRSGTSRSAGALARWISTRPGLPWLGAAALYLAVALHLPATPFLFARGDQLFAHVLFGLIAVLVVSPAVFASNRPSVPSRVLGSPAVAWLGLISYGIFLWHYVFTIKLGYVGSALSFPAIVAITLAGSICCAALSYYLVERPILRLKYRRILRRREPEPSPRP